MFLVLGFSFSYLKHLLFAPNVLGFHDVPRSGMLSSTVFWEGTKLDSCVHFDIFTQKPKIHAEGTGVGTGTDAWNGRFQGVTQYMRSHQSVITDPLTILLEKNKIGLSSPHIQNSIPVGLKI